jgi:predicted ABC-type transport system involved in lysophospholipase L1 biosynthesis ATPase subunit
LVTHDRELTRQARRLIRLRGGKLVLDSDERKAKPAQA